MLTNKERLELFVHYFGKENFILLCPDCVSVPVYNLLTVILGTVSSSQILTICTKIVFLPNVTNIDML